MSDDLTQPIDQLETNRRAEWLVDAAHRAGWHRPDDAPRLVDAGDVTTAEAAEQRVLEFTSKRGYVARERPISAAEQRRRWGADLLARIDSSSSGGGR